ncbi:MAG: Trk system potassium transporter TrkA [Erysipelotrichales bacterium]|nr:Trk system potassium transporter TrkA [Erysipelotrichales bacterium]
MNIIIVGDGKVGSTLTSQLAKEGHQVVVIDNRSSVLKEAVNRDDVLVVEGNGATMQILREASAEKSDLIIAATSADEVNILSCLVAKKLGCKHTIARVRNPEYASQLEFMKEELGLSMSVNPELAAAQEIARIVSYPNALKIDSFLRGRVELIEIKLEAGNPLINKSLFELPSAFKVKVLVCAIKRGSQVLIPKGNVVLKEGDKITVTGSVRDVNDFFKAIGIAKRRIRSAMLVGGGKVAYYLTKRLTESGIYVKIIEKDSERCRFLCENLPRAVIVEGDGTNRDLLLEEGLEKMDAFISLTDMDEENVIISMYATHSGVNKVITKVNRIPYLDLLEKMGIDTVISPKNIIAAQIVRFVRAMANAENTTLESLYRIVDNQVEALEFSVPNGGSYLHKPLKDLALRNNLLLASIYRRGSVIHPSGLDVLEPGDHVIVVTTEEGLQDIRDIFARGSGYEL